jgi:hypothetical protein
MPEEQVTEFRAGTVDDLLVAAKGGATPAADDAKRYKSLAMAAGISSAVLALALVVVIVTGTGDKGGSKSESTTATTEAPFAPPPDTSSYFIPVDAALAGTLHPGTHVTVTGRNQSTDAVVTIEGVVLSTATKTDPPLSKGGAPRVSATSQVAIPNNRVADYTGIEARTRQLAVTTAAPTTTAPPATQPATTPSS